MEQQKAACKIITLETKYKPKLEKDYERQSMKEYFEHDDYKLLKFQASNPKKEDSIIGSSQQNGFVTAFRIAYQYHMPLELKPDTIWLTVCQGFASHILKNSEELRKEFVDFDGKKTLRVNCDDFEFGSPDNDWPSFFTQISDKIKDILGKKAHEMFVYAFSTTTPLDKTVYESTLLSAMQKYFCYVCCTACAIPKVRLLGTPNDWKKLRDKISEISRFNLDWWISKLLPIIDKMIAAAVDGQVDSDFWNSVYKVACPDMSGAVMRINGWMGNFFPYLDSEKNQNLRDLDQILKTMKEFDDQYLVQEYQCSDDDEDDEPKPPKLSPEEKAIRQEKIKKAFMYFETFCDAERVPSGITKAPFKWEVDGEEKDMKLMSGFFGAQLTEDGFIRPKVGWAVGQVLQQPQPVEVNYDSQDQENIQ